MEKTTSDFSRVKSVSKSSNNRIKRSEMIRTLETHPSETRAPVTDTQIATYADPLDNLPSQGISSSADNLPSQEMPSGTDDIPGLDSGEGQQGIATDSQPPDVPQVEPATSSLVRGEGEGGERHSAVSDLVMANLVEMSGRQMCRLCGMQVTLT